MPHPLLPARLSAVVVALLAGRSTKAVFAARADGSLRDFSTTAVEDWIGRRLTPESYLQAERAADRAREYSRRWQQSYREGGGHARNTAA
jgi:hypothetical protein